MLLGVLGSTIKMLVHGRPDGAFLSGICRLFGLPLGGEQSVRLHKPAVAQDDAS